MATKGKSRQKETVNANIGFGLWEIVSDSLGIAQKVSKWFGAWADARHPVSSNRLSAKIVLARSAVKTGGTQSIHNGKEGMAVKLNGISMNADWRRVPWNVDIHYNARQIETALRVITRLLAMYSALVSGGIVLHASSAILNGRVVVFAGKSGVGKSTAVNKFPESSRLDDDTVILMEHAGIWVRPDMPNLEAPSLSAPNEPGEMPVGVLILPEPAAVFNMRPLSRAEAFRACLHLPPAWMLPENPVPGNALQGVLSEIGLLINSVKVLRMGWHLSDDLPSLIAGSLSKNI